MKFKAIVAITLSLSLLTACGANQHKENNSKSNDTNKKTQQTDNTTQSNTDKQMTPQEAEDIVRNNYKARGVNEYQTLNYKTNLERSNEHEYYVEHLVRDAVGTPYVALLLIDTMVRLLIFLMICQKKIKKNLKHLKREALNTTQV